MNKTKEKGDIKKSITVTANGIQFLDGETCTRHYKVPIILLDYHSPASAHPYAQGERFALWCKLEDAQYKKVVKQLNPNLKEMTIWFDGENQEIIKQFVKEEKKDE